MTMETDLDELIERTIAFGKAPIQELKARDKALNDKSIEYRQRWGLDVWRDAVIQRMGQLDKTKKAEVELGLDRSEWWSTVGMPETPTAGDPGVPQ